MSRTHIVGLACIAVLTVTAMTSASASAAEWLIGSKALPSGSKAPLTSKAVTDEPALLNVPGLGLKLSCTSTDFFGAFLVGPDITTITQLTHLGCSEITPSTCKIEPSTVVLEPLVLLIITGSGTSDFLEFQPATGTVIGTLTFTGTCSFAGEQPLSGKYKLSMPTGQTEETSQAISGLGSLEGNTSLIFDKNIAFIEKGKALLSLVSGSKWSFR
jgi:hypothetical protein